MYDYEETPEKSTVIIRLLLYTLRNFYFTL